MALGITEGEIWRQLYELAAKCQPIIAKSTVCLLAYQGELKVAGSGVLLRIANRYFLASAAHVLDFTYYHEFLFHVSTSTDIEPAQPVPLLFKLRRSSARPKDSSPGDSDLRDDDREPLRAAEVGTAKCSTQSRALCLSRWRIDDCGWFRLNRLPGGEPRAVASAVAFQPLSLSQRPVLAWVGDDVLRWT